MAGNRFTNGWTDEEKETVKRRWQEGASASVIAGELKRGRNAVIGLIFRMRQKGESLDARPTVAAVSRNRLRSVRHRKASRPRKAEPPPFALPYDEPEPEHFAGAAMLIDRQHLIRARGQLDVPFIDNDGCRWPGWPATEKIGTCCGLPRHVEREKVYPYCRVHLDAASGG